MHEMNRNIIKCVQNGDIPGLRRIILSKNEDVDFINVCNTQSGDTVAVLAARYGQLDMLKFVYMQTPGAVELANLDGKRPLHEAAQHGQLACVRFLLSCSVDVDSLKRADWCVYMFHFDSSTRLVLISIVDNYR